MTEYHKFLCSPLYFLFGIDLSLSYPWFESPPNFFIDRMYLQIKKDYCVCFTWNIFWTSLFARPNWFIFYAELFANCLVVYTLLGFCFTWNKFSSFVSNARLFCYLMFHVEQIINNIRWLVPSSWAHPNRLHEYI